MPILAPFPACFDPDLIVFRAAPSGTDSDNAPVETPGPTVGQPVPCSVQQVTLTGNDPGGEVAPAPAGQNDYVIRFRAYPGAIVKYQAMSWTTHYGIARPVADVLLATGPADQAGADWIVKATRVE